MTAAGPTPVTLRVSPAELVGGGAVVVLAGGAAVEGAVVEGAVVDVVVVGPRVVPVPDEDGLLESPWPEPQAPATRPTVARSATQPPRRCQCRRCRRSSLPRASRRALRRAPPTGQPRPTNPLSRGLRGPNHRLPSQKGRHRTSSWYARRVPVKNVSHIAIGVRDMERSLPFWTEVVGLHVTLDTVEEFTIGGEVVRRRGVYLRERRGPTPPSSSWTSN